MLVLGYYSLILAFLAISESLSRRCYNSTLLSPFILTEIIPDSCTMLADEVKDRIQSVYRQLLESRDLTPRYGQRQMIAEIANVLSVLANDEEAD